jgi:uncharacterized cofD-like protein
VLGIFIFCLGMAFLFRSLMRPYMTQNDPKLVEMLFEERVLSRGPKIAAIGGGTGLSTLLRGLKEYSSNITAIVAVSDDGGSSGRLRKDFNISAPGDIRNCILALAKTESLMHDLFQYRFEAGELSGHRFGNLFLVAMAEVSGSFVEGVKQSQNVLAVTGKVLPSSTDVITLNGVMEDDSILKGETTIADSPKKIKKVFIKPRNAHAMAETVSAILDADIVVLGPGSLYTSVLPNLLVPDILEALKKTKAKKLYVVNMMTQPGETDYFTASDHVKAIYAHTKSKILDAVLVNKSKMGKELLEKYAEKGSYPVIQDIDELKALGVEVIAENFTFHTELARHDSKELGYAVIKYIAKSSIKK